MLCIAAVPRIWLAWSDQGVFWPDEIYQSLEPAHRFAFGYGFQAWEFRDGARSWLFPGVIGVVWKIAEWLGVNQAPTLVVLAKLLMVALSLASILACMRIADRLAGPWAALVAGTLSAFFPASLVFSSRCLSETASAPLIAWAVLLIMEPSRRRLLFAGVLACAATFLRYQNGLLLLGLLGILLAERRGRDARQVAIGAAAVGLAGALLDLVTWGRVFHSLRVYLQFNAVEGKASQLGTAPLSYYVAVLFSSTGWSMLVVAVGIALAWRKARTLIVLSLGFIAVHSLIPHKELRFVVPAIPLLLAAAAVGVTEAVKRVVEESPAEPTALQPSAAEPRQVSQFQTAVLVVCGVTAVSMGVRAKSLTFGDMSQNVMKEMRKASVWHWNEPVNRLLWSAGLKSDLCGLALAAYAPMWTGGYAYLHRKVPFTNISIDPLLANQDAGAAGTWTNYVIAPATMVLPSDYTPVQTVGPSTLYRRAGTCAAPPAKVAATQYDLELANARALARWLPLGAAVPAVAGSLQSTQTPQPPANRVPIPLAQVDPSILLPLFESETAKGPKNAALRRQYADYCWERKLPCAKAQNEVLLDLVPGDPSASERVKSLK